MANMLSHALAAMAFQGFLMLLFGGPSISTGTFIAGLLAMLIELDYAELSSNHRTPIGHSLAFGIIWVLAGWVILSGIFIVGFISSDLSLELTLALISAFATHLMIDSFTREGIYTYPKTTNPKRWLNPLLVGDDVCWKSWGQFPKEERKKKLKISDDPILNIFVSIPSLLLVIVLVAILPL
jgi:hypothetical protein